MQFVVDPHKGEIDAACNDFYNRLKKRFPKSKFTLQWTVENVEIEGVTTEPSSTSKAITRPLDSAKQQPKSK